VVRFSPDVNAVTVYGAAMCEQVVKHFARSHTCNPPRYTYWNSHEDQKQ